MTSFEELLLTEQNCGWSGADVCCILGMSDRFIAHLLSRIVRLEETVIARR